MAAGLESTWIRVRRTWSGQLLLQIFALPYSVITRLRNWCYDRGLLRVRRFAIPVISIGNITLGGSGKTPLVIELVQQLVERGFKPVVISRGYRSSGNGCRIVTEESSPGEVGDEPLLLSRKLGVPVVVEADRVKALEFVVARDLGDIIVLDDGFQHRRLGRNFDLLTIAIDGSGSVSEVLNDSHFPAGRLREDRDVALKRADAVVLMSRTTSAVGADQKSQIEKILPDALELFSGSYRLKGIRRLSDGSPLAEGLEVVGFCGIGGPRVFQQTLESAGCQVKFLKMFPDHYPVTSGDLVALKDEFPGVPLVCTEKDAVKILPADAEGVYVVEVGCCLDDVERLVGKMVDRCAC